MLIAQNMVDLLMRIDLIIGGFLHLYQQSRVLSMRKNPVLHLLLAGAVYVFHVHNSTTLVKYSTFQHSYLRISYVENWNQALLLVRGL